MQQLIVYFFKALRKVWHKLILPYDYLGCYVLLYINNVKFSSFRSNGLPKLNIGMGGKCIIGSNFRMNNRESSNPIGRFHKCSLVVGRKGHLIIGKNVGMSSTSIVCHAKIEIGDNVKIGGNVVIYDTDFHSLNSDERIISMKDERGTKRANVKIENNVFIGAHSTILKGVNIGENAIIGACSVVTKNIPNDEIWGGNPAKFIRSQKAFYEEGI